VIPLDPGNSGVAQATTSRIERDLADGAPVPEG
jgi:hypothetical protein